MHVCGNIRGLQCIQNISQKLISKCADISKFRIKNILIKVSHAWFHKHVSFGSSATQHTFSL